MTVELSKRELELLMSMIFAASISGEILEEMADLKRKLKVAHDTEPSRPA